MKKRNIMVLMISLSLVLLLGSSYALLRSTQVGSTPYVINVGTLQVTFDSSKTEKLSLENMYPMSDKEGSSQSKELGFTVKNTGKVKAIYNVYLEETSTNPEFKKVIRYISNKNNQGYNEPKTLIEDKYIDIGSYLEPDASSSYKVKVWLDYNAGNEYMDKTFTAKVVVESTQADVSDTLYTKINNAVKEHPGTAIEEDGITYLSGSNETVNYNYVWYSGKLWRITAINPDGTIKMVTENCITVIQWGLDINFTYSWVKEWLNEDFKEILANDENIITDYDWNASSVSDYISKPDNTTIVKEKIGLLNSHDYYKSYENVGDATKSYLNTKASWFLLNSKDNTEKIYIYLGNFAVTLQSQIGVGASGVRPAIVLQPNLTTYEGDGSKEHPYVIDDTTKSITYNSTKLDTRVSGEYVKFYNDIYRIVNIEDTKATKLVAENYFSKDNQVVLKSISSSVYYGSGSDDSYWDYYLNNVWYKEIPENYQKMLVKSKYYLGFYQVNQSYKNTICKSNNTKETIKNCEKINTIWEGYVGLLRAGEMFEAIENEASISNGLWIITPYSTSGIRYLTVDNGHLSDGTYNTSTRAVRPTISISKDVVIVSGDGMTPSTAFEIALP